MSRILLVSHAHHDIQTEYLTSWFDKVLDIVKKQKDTKVVEILKEEATKANFIKLINQENPQFVIFNGHGTDDSIMGFEREILVKCGDNERILLGKIVHSMACKCAGILGSKCISIGTKSFIGYKEDFELWCSQHPNKEEQLKDQMAGLFLEPAYEAVIALIEGVTAHEAYKRSQDMYKQNLLALITSKNSQHSTIVANSLYNNFMNQVCLGDQSAFF